MVCDDEEEQELEQASVNDDGDILAAMAGKFVSSVIVVLVSIPNSILLIMLSLLHSDPNVHRKLSTWCGVNRM